MNHQKKRLKASYRNAKQLEEVLFRRESFNESIASLRKKWHIPPKGLSKAEYNDSWQVWFAINNKRYKPTENDIRLEKERQKRIDSCSVKAIDGFDKLIDNYISLDSIDAERAIKNDIGDMLISQKLNPSWYKFIEHYLIFNKKIRVPSGMLFSTTVDEYSGQEVIILTITDVTRKADLLAAWPVIKGYQEKLPYYSHIKNQPRRTYIRNKKVAGMKRLGKSMDTITKYLDTEYPKKNGDIYTPEDVYKMIAEYDKAIEKS